jgi:hypothetical protein
LRFLLLSLGSLCWAFPGTAPTAPSQRLPYDAATKTVTKSPSTGDESVPVGRSRGPRDVDRRELLSRGPQLAELRFRRRPYVLVQVGLYILRQRFCPLHRGRQRAGGWG